jgi:RNA polymerase sigma-70 factor, ECF subfamily
LFWNLHVLASMLQPFTDFGVIVTNTMEQTAEQTLVERAKTDAGAFGELYDLYYLRILHYVLRRVGDLATAEDITAETFVRALDRLYTFTWRGAPFSAWLYRLASNEIANHFRKKHTKDASLEELMDEYMFEPASDTDIEAALIAAQEEIARHKQFVQVRQAILRLPLPYQEALSLRYFEKKSIDEISQIMGKRPGTVKSLLSRGIRKIRSTGMVQPFDETAVIVSGDKKP